MTAVAEAPQRRPRKSPQRKAVDPRAEVFYLALGRRIARLRKAMRKSQGELAQLSGFTVASICSIEKGRQRSPAFEVFRMFEALVPPILYKRYSPGLTEEDRKEIRTALAEIMPEGSAEECARVIEAPTDWRVLIPSLMVDLTEDGGACQVHTLVDDTSDLDAFLAPIIEAQGDGAIEDVTPKPAAGGMLQELAAANAEIATSIGLADETSGPQDEPEAAPAETIAPEVETVKAGEKGLTRARKDPRVKPFLSSKRPPESDVQRIISYRTEAAVGYNAAVDQNADADVIEFLAGEHEWAIQHVPAEVREQLERVSADLDALLVKLCRECEKPLETKTEQMAGFHAEKCLKAEIDRIRLENGTHPDAEMIRVGDAAVSTFDKAIVPIQRDGAEVYQAGAFIWASRHDAAVYLAAFRDAASHGKLIEGATFDPNVYIASLAPAPSFDVRRAVDGEACGMCQAPIETDREVVDFDVSGVKTAVGPCCRHMFE